MVDAKVMEKALRAYYDSQGGPNVLSKREVARRYNLKESTFREYVKGRPLGSKRGPPSTLTDDEEDALVAALLELAANGFPATKWKLKVLVKDIVRDGRQHRFSHNGLSDKWVNAFLRRHSDKLSMRKSRIIDASRVNSYDVDEIECFFAEYEHYIEKHQLPPTRLYNCDESGVSPQGGDGTKVVAARGAKAVYEKRGQNRENTTVLMTVSAAGVMVPPVFLYKGKRFSSDLLKDGPPGCCGTATENAFIDTESFELYVDHFAKHIPPARPVLLILDNHKSHVALTVLEKFRQHDIDVMTLPPHMTHLMQPLDDGMFRSFKSAWRTVIREWSSATQGASLPRNLVASMVHKALERSWGPGMITGSWRSTGMWPVDRSIPLSRQVPGNPNMPQSNYAGYDLVHDPLPLSSMKPRDLKSLKRDGIDPSAYRAYSIVKKSIGVSPPKQQRDRVLLDMTPKRLLTHDDCMAELRLKAREAEEARRGREEKKETAARKKEELQIEKLARQLKRQEQKRVREATELARKAEVEVKRQKREALRTEKAAAARLKRSAKAKMKNCGATDSNKSPMGHKVSHELDHISAQCCPTNTLRTPTGSTNPRQAHHGVDEPQCVSIESAGTILEFVDL